MASPQGKLFRLNWFAAFFLLSLGNCFSSSAQRKDYFPYFSNDTLAHFQLAQAHKNTLKAKLVAPKSANNDYKDHFKRLQKDISEETYNTIRYTAVLDTVMNPYIQKVFKTVLAANPEMAGTELILSKSPVPNAYALPDGSILFNIGLLAKLENESQLVSVICHELAHIRLQHFENGLHKQLTNIHNKQLKKEVKKIIRGKYNVNSKIRSLVMGVSLNHLYHNRAHETQADSLGYIFFTNTKYDISQAPRLFDVLEASDEPESKANIDFARYFNCADHKYPFQNTEPTKPKSIFAVKLTEEQEKFKKSDTLKTHPDCSVRKAYILKMAQAISKPGGSVLSSPAFNNAKQISRYEVLQSYFDFGYYDYSFFLALQLLEEQPDNAYLRSMVLLSMYKFKDLLQNHEFAEMISTASEYQSDNFNHMLGVLNNFSVSDYKNLAGCFYKASPITPNQNEYTIAAQYAYLFLTDRNTEAETIRKQYQSKFKSGRFAKMLGLPEVPKKTK